MFLHCYIIFKHRLNTSWKVVPTVLINSFFKWILNSFTMAISFDWKQDMYIYIILWSRHWFSLPEHPSSPPVFCGVCVARSLVLCVCFVDRCLSFCPFSFGHCVFVCRSLFVLLYFFFWPLCCMFVDFVCPFVLFLLAIVLSVLLQFVAFDYLFGIFKLFLST